MKTKKPSIIAAVIGSLCLAFAYWMQSIAVGIMVAVPNAHPNLDDRYFYWPLFAGIALLAFACLSFLSHILAHRKHDHSHAA
jgi:TRAP-type C4-dicarboxylate transport system permease small subunit